jgi:uncharacterized protein YktA (UPF0223 family)
VFNDPVNISPLSEQDILVVHFKSTEFFYSETVSQNLNKKYVTMRSGVKKQLEDTKFNQEFTETSDQSSQAMKIMMIVSFIMNTMMSGSSQYYFITWINTM